MSSPSPQDVWRGLPIELTETELRIGGKQVMQAWERPLMEVLAREVAAEHGDILEVGYGMGISADAVVRNGCRSYTVIEAHPLIADHARQWAQTHATPITVLEGFWQEIAPTLTARFDGILFDTFPITQEDSQTNPMAMIPTMASLLRPGGVLTYYSGETEYFKNDQLVMLLSLFEEVRLLRVSGLQPYPHPACDYWNRDYMIVPVARLARSSH